MSEQTTAELIEELEKTAWQGSLVLRILRRLDREKADKEQQSGEQPETPTMPEIEAGRAQFEKFLGPIPKPPSSPVPSQNASPADALRPNDRHGQVPSLTARETPEQIAERMVVSGKNHNGEIRINDPRPGMNQMTYVEHLAGPAARNACIEVLRNFITAAIELGQKQAVAEAEPVAWIWEFREKNRGLPWTENVSTGKPSPDITDFERRNIRPLYLAPPSVADAETRARIDELQQSGEQRIPDPPYEVASSDGTGRRPPSSPVQPSKETVQIREGGALLTCMICGKPIPEGEQIYHGLVSNKIQDWRHKSCSPVPSPTAREIAENNSILAMQQLGAEGYTIDHPRSSPATIWEGVRKIITAAIELGQKQPADAETRARMDMKFAWVIEHAESEPSRPRYYTGFRHPAMHWSDPGDNSAACRFARKQDAERVADLAGFYKPNPTHRICEHGWEE